MGKGAPPSSVLKSAPALPPRQEATHWTEDAPLIVECTVMSSSLSSRIFVETTAGIIVARFVDSQIVAEDVVHEVEEQLKELAETHAAGDVLLSFHEVQ